MTVGVLFLLALFFAPFAGAILDYASACAPLLACVMARGLGEAIGGMKSPNMPCGGEAIPRGVLFALKFAVTG